MTVLKYEELTQTSVSRLDPQRTFVIATFSPLEVHGPHLPLGQDVFEAYHLAQTAGALLTDRRPEWTTVLLPSIPVACDTVPMFGSIPFPVSLCRDVAFHTLAPFARRGFTRLAFSSFHGGPRHILALEEAADRLAEIGDSACVSLFSAMLARVHEGALAHDAIMHRDDVDLTLQEAKEDQHAGFLETSIALHLWPDLVEEGWDELEPSVPPKSLMDDGSESFLFGHADDPGLTTRIRRGLSTADALVRSIRHYYNSSYYGHPRYASAESGERILDTIATAAIDVVEGFLDLGQGFDGTSPLTPLRPLVASDRFNALVEKIAGQ